MATYTQILQATSVGYNSGPFNVYYNIVSSSNFITGSISSTTLLSGLQIQIPTQSYAVIVVDQSSYCGNQSQTFSVIPYTPPPSSAPVTPAPVTPAPVTPAPVTPAPITPGPVTPAPVTPAPVTPAPVTPAPVTPAPVTPAPVTPAPVTPAPVTPAPIVPYTAYSVYYGSTAGNACAKTILVTLYWTGAGNWGDDLEYFTDPGLTTHANGYYTNGAGYYYRIDNTGFIVNWGTPGIPAACPAPTPAPATPAPVGSFNHAVPPSGNFIGGTNLSCTPSSPIVQIYLNSADYSTFSSNGNNLTSGMTLYSNGSGTLVTYNSIYDPTSNPNYSYSNVIWNINGSGIITTVRSQC